MLEWAPETCTHMLIPGSALAVPSGGCMPCRMQMCRTPPCCQSVALSATILCCACLSDPSALRAQDDFYNRYLVRHNLFESVIQAFLANGPRYNLLNRCNTPEPLFA